MHLVIPFAAPVAEAGRRSLQGVAPRELAALLACAREDHRHPGDEWSFTPPHERALAHAFGWQGADGAWPFAARAAAADGLAPEGHAWGLLTPVHWHLGTEQLSLLDPEALMLDAAAARTLYDAVEPLFTSEGFVMRFCAPLRWYVAHPSLAALPTASLDRVIGRNVDRWLTDAPAVRLVRRLQNEVQMLLYTHPANEERQARGLLPVNSVWLSGCGVAQPEQASPVVDDRLRTPALAENWPAWVRAWETLDSGPIAALRERFAHGDDTVRLTLAGEREAVTLRPVGGAWRRLRARIAPPSALAVLERL